MDGVDRRGFLAYTAAVAATGCLGDGGTGDGEERFAVETVAEGLTDPWGIGFLAESGTGAGYDSRVLVTERTGSLVLVDRDDGSVETVAGTPEVYDAGQGGLLDVTVHPEYPDDRRVYLTYSATEDGSGRSATHLGAGTLDTDAPRLGGFEVLHVAEPYVDSVNHYGSRAVFGNDGALYVTSGDRQFKNFGPGHVSQDVTNELGCVLRLGDDGTAPSDNPFAEDPAARDAVYSYGHRNPQGLDVHPETGELWETEHGERDGDEINVLEGGANYGWPVASESCEYGTDTPVGAGHEERDDVTAPVHHWDCGSGGFPPSGAVFYDGDAFPDWRGDLFIGNLAGQYLGRFRVDGRDVRETEALLEGQGWRVRDVAVGPDDGYLYVLVDGDDAPVVRLVPRDA